MYQFTSNNERQIPSIEKIRNDFKLRMIKSLDKTINIGNILTFAKDTKAELMLINRDVLKFYDNTALFAPKRELSDNEREKIAFSLLNLPDLDSALSVAEDIGSKIEKLQERADTSKSIYQLLSLPDVNINFDKQDVEISEGLESRLLNILYILEQDLNFPEDSYTVLKSSAIKPDGEKENIVSINTPSLKRHLMLYDGKDESFVLDSDILNEHQINHGELIFSPSSQIDNLIKNIPHSGIKIASNKYWREISQMAMTEDLPETFNADDMIWKGRELTKLKRSEIIKGKEWLNFDELRRQVREEYAKQGRPKISIFAWYAREFRKHPGWNSDPFRPYRDKGWISWPDLVGKEEYPEYKDFKEAVTAAWIKGGSPKAVREWYDNEKEFHTDWHSFPPYKYKNEGWESWSALVGKKSPFEKRESKFPKFSEFKDEVIKAYNEAGRPFQVGKWYDTEFNQHNWPSSPRPVYQGEGWEGFPALVNKTAEEIKRYKELKKTEK